MSSQRHIALFLSSSCQAKSYYLTIDRAPSIQLFGTSNTSSYQNTSVRKATSFPISGLSTSELDFFRIYHPSPTRGPCVLGFDAWGYFATSPRNSTLSSGRSVEPGRLSTWKFEYDELCREAIAPVEVYIEEETGKLFAFDLALERAALRRRGTRATEARR